jgi:leader peptidase (prepilin peptidase)/N-methyltransferase
VPIVILFVLGLCLGSFINALVWRIHEQEKAKNKGLSILSGRSQCPHCSHELAPKDLIPIFSWLSLRGRCRYCYKPISRQYPIVEASTALWFVLSYIYWPGGIYGIGDWLLFAGWLAASVGLIALAVYDWLWGLLPNRILYPTLAVALATRLSFIFIFTSNIARNLLLLGISLLLASGLFWLLFTVSKGKWIGYGDVRLGLILGTVLASPSKSLLMIFLASILGTVFAVPGLLSHSRALASKIPFGPFLIAATGLSLLFGGSIISWYKNLM